MEELSRKWVNISDVVKNISVDPDIFTSGWLSLYHALGLNESHVPQDLNLMLTKWVSNSKEEATIQNLISILAENNFANSRDLLKTIYLESQHPDVPIYILNSEEPEKCKSVIKPVCKAFIFILVLNATVVLVAVGYLICFDSKSLKFEGDSVNCEPNYTTKWYQMQRPSVSFKGREIELNMMKDSFIDNNNTGAFSTIFITGREGIGKSELARYFAYKLFLENKVNCYWINGSNLKVETEKFLKLELGIQLNLDLNNFSSPVSENGYYPWLIIFDGINSQESIHYLKRIYEKFKQNNKANNPLVLLTSTIKTIYTQIPFSKSVGIYINLFEYESLAHVFANEITPYIRFNLDHELLNGSSVCDKIDNTFTQLDQIPIESSIKIRASFSLMSLLSYFLNGKSDKQHFVNFWGMALNKTISNEVLNEVLATFIENKLILTNTVENVITIQTFSSDVATVISKHYLAQPWVQSEFKNELSFELTTVNILRWIMQSLIMYLNSPTHNRAGLFLESTQILNVLEQILREPKLVKEFENHIPEFGEYFEIESLTLAFYTYLEYFGGNNSQTLEFGDQLAATFFEQELYEESGELYELLYNLKKHKYGKVSRKALDDGDQAVTSFKKHGLRTEAFIIVSDMISNCKEIGCGQEITEGRNYWWIQYLEKPLYEDLE